MTQDTSRMDALHAARRRYDAKRQSGQIEVLDPIQKALATPKSLRLAINGKCWDCCGGGGDGAGVTRWLIGNCEADDCALHAQRPYKKQEGAKKPTLVT